MKTFFVVMLSAALLSCGNPPPPNNNNGGICEAPPGFCDDVGACGAPTSHTGEATFYAADGSGNCSFDPSPQDLHVAAMNDADYENSATCGACVRLTGPLGEETVRIVDRCPGCAEGDLDLSQESFALIAQLADGRVPITWEYVPCAVTGPIVYHFKEGTNPFFTAVQIRNHRNPIATFEALDGNGQFITVDRVNFNFFIENAGLGPGPYTFRVTDVFGEILEDSNVPFIEAGDVEGSGQFSVCTP